MKPAQDLRCSESSDQRPLDAKRATRFDTGPMVAGRGPARAALAALALIVCVRAHAGFAEGALLIAPGPVLKREPQYWIIDLASGRRIALPRSGLSLRASHSRDTWYGGVNSNVLVRVDDVDQVDIYDRKTLDRVGGFALHRLPGVRHPDFVGAVKPSPDGRYLLASWRPDRGDDEPTLAVFDRNGRVVETGLPYRYDRRAFRNAFDWLPDGSYVYLAGDKLVLRTPGSKTVGTVQVRLPPNVTTEEADMAVSPDGRRIVWSLTDISRHSANVRHRFLYVSNLDGSDMRQLTTLTPERLPGPVDWGHVHASWSPSGNAIVFWASTDRDLLGRGLAVRSMQSGCPRVFIAPASATRASLDRDEVPPGSPIVSPRVPGHDGRLLACATGLLWLK
jgi:WD40 repeat protein